MMNKILRRILVAASTSAVLAFLAWLSGFDFDYRIFHVACFTACGIAIAIAAAMFTEL